MIRKILPILFISYSVTLFAQYKYEVDTITKQTLFQRLSKLEKKQDLANVTLHLKGSLNANFVNRSQQYVFRMDQIRLQISGSINKWLSYNYRQRLNYSFDGSSSRDHTSTALDMAYITVKPCDNLFITLGKQAAAYGGYEFDHNPVDIYQYSNMSNTLTDFATGITVGYQVTPEHTLSLQIVEARTDMDKLGYESLKQANAPFSYSLYWSGSMFKNYWNTLWSVSYIKDVSNYNRYMIALGNQINFCNKWSLEADLTYSNEKIDTKGILSLPEYRATNVNYFSGVAKLNYRFRPKWNIFAKGIYEIAGFSKNNEYLTLKKGIFATYIGYIGGLEFYPMNENLRFFVTYLGANSKYKSECAKVNGFVNPEEHGIALGFIYKLPVF